jgi:thioredoxin-dependent peroxiredoxin
MLNVGEKAPDFTLNDDAGVAVSLTDQLARGPVVVYFYPRDFTPVCTAEACMFRDAHQDLVAAGVRVLGISTQSAASHAKFKRTFKLPFPLLADADKAVAKAFGVLSLFGLVVRRATFLVMPDGTIADREVADLSAGAHERFVMRVLKKFEKHTT